MKLPNDLSLSQLDVKETAASEILNIKLALKMLIVVLVVVFTLQPHPRC